MNQKDFDSRNGFTKPSPKSIKELCQKSSRYLRRQLCTRRGLLSILYSRVPVVRWMQSYKHENLVPDIVAGVTLAIYNVPQSMAYSVLATLPPVFGLYASFFPPLFYFLFGTSSHISIGVFSLTCIMTGHARLSVLPNDVNGTAATDYGGAHDLTPIDVVVLLAFLTGIIQLMMWVLHLSFLSTYLTDSAVTGLTVGAAIHAMTAQVKGLLGITLRHTSGGFLQLFGKWYAIAEALPNTNLVTLAISVSTITFLVLYKKIVEPILKKKNISLPAELLALVIITFISAVAHFHDRFGVIIVGDIPTGLPPPKVPLFEEVLIKRLIVPAASIAVVAYAVTVSMGKLFARKHKYHINPNQEILALGIASTISSFFSVLPISTSLSRSLVNEGAGARTQVVWVATAVITICWDIIAGLVTGIVLALITIVFRTQRPSIALLGEVDRSDYRAIDNYTRAKRTNTPILRFDAPVIFTNVELLKERVGRILKQETEITEKKKPESVAMGPNWKAIILDCSSWTYTDAMGVEAMREINDELRSKQVLLILANMKSSIRLQYALAGLFKSFHENQICPTIADALSIAAGLNENAPAFIQADENGLVAVK